MTFTMNLATLCDTYVEEKMTPMDAIWLSNSMAVLAILATSAIKYLKWWAKWLTIHSIVGEKKDYE